MYIYLYLSLSLYIFIHIKGGTSAVTQTSLDLVTKAGSGLGSANSSTRAQNVFLSTKRQDLGVPQESRGNSLALGVCIHHVYIYIYIYTHIYIYIYIYT